MRGELNLVCVKMELLEQFPGMTMSEDCIRGEIVSGVHEVSLCRRGLSGSAHSGLRIADDTVGNVDETSLKQWRKCEDDRSGVASGVGDETGLPDLVAMQFWASIDCFCLQLGGSFGIYVRQTVHGTVDMIF
jgi:hypothetical protein